MSKVLVIREFDGFSRLLDENGFEVLNLPLIETGALGDLSDFEERLAMLEKYDGIFLTSRHAAQVLAEKTREKKIVFFGKIHVLGRRSFEILRGAGFDPIFDETANTAREMLERIAPGDLKNKRFLFIRGMRSLRIVPEFLSDFAQVDETVVYETRAKRLTGNEKKKVREVLEKGEIAAVCFFSPSAAESFLEQFDAKVLHQTRIATIGKTTAEFFERRNLNVDFISPKASADDFAIGLVNYLGNKLPAEGAERRGKNLNRNL